MNIIKLKEDPRYDNPEVQEFNGEFITDTEEKKMNNLKPNDIIIHSNMKEKRKVIAVYGDKVWLAYLTPDGIEGAYDYFESKVELRDSGWRLAEVKG